MGLRGKLQLRLRWVCPVDEAAADAGDACVPFKSGMSRTGFGITATLNQNTFANVPFGPVRHIDTPDLADIRYRGEQESVQVDDGGAKTAGDRGL